ncbi:MAG: glycosyltransferase family 9 protein [Pseudomonadota bacterium]
MSDPDRLCILRLSAIGDCVHTLAVVRALQLALPKTRITWVIGKTEASLMQGLDDVELLVYEKSAGKREQQAFLKTLATRQFDVLLNMHASWRANRISRFIRAPRKIGFDRARARDAQWLFTNERIAPAHQPHVIDGLFGFAARLGVPRDDLQWRLPLGPEDYALADRINPDAKPLIVISPCSSQRARNYRNWPVERFVDVVRTLLERYDSTIAVTGSDSEEEHRYAASIAAVAPDAIHNLVGQSSLKSLAALIDRAACVICPDSGPAHIASAVDTPVIGMYATSNPGRTGPVRNPEYTVNRYPDAVQRYLNRSVDNVRWGRRVRHPDAMLLIDTQSVEQQIDRILG